MKICDCLTLSFNLCVANPILQTYVANGEGGGVKKTLAIS